MTEHRQQAYSFRRKSWVRDEGEVSFVVWDLAGPKAPWLHFAHANGFNCQTYAAVLEPLSSHFNIIASDARGHGQTTLRADPAAMRAKGWKLYVDDMKVLLDWLDRPLVLAGHSLGSVVSLLTAATRPGNIQKIILIDPVILHPTINILWAISKITGHNKHFDLVQKAAKRRRIFDSKDAIIQSYSGRGGFSTWMCDECLRNYVEGGTRALDSGNVELTCDPLWESATFSQMNEWTWTALKHLSMPCTILYGSDSNTFRSDTVDVMRLIRPNVTLVAVPGTGHFLPMEAPAEVGRLLLEHARC